MARKLPAFQNGNVTHEIPSTLNLLTGRSLQISSLGFQTSLFRGLGGSEKKGHGGVGGAGVAEGLAVAPDAEEGFLVFEVVHDHGDGAIGVEGGGGNEFVAGRGAGDAFGTGSNEPGKLAEYIVWGIEGEFAGGSVSVDNSAGARTRGAPSVARATFLVAHKVPDNPTFGPVVEVIDDVPSKPESRGPIAPNSAFRVKQVFVRIGVMDDADVIPVVSGIPVEGSAPDVLGGVMIVIGGLDTLVKEAAIVVPDHKLDLGEVGFFKGGSEEVFDEVSLLLGSEDARFPNLGGEGLVLDGKAPHGDALPRVGLDVLHEVVSPSLIVFRLELAAVEHVVVGFHPSRGAPGRGEETQVALGRSLGAFDERDAVLEVAGDGEVFEVLVAGRVVVSVHFAGVVAAMDRGAAKGVAIAFGGVEAGLKKLFLRVLGEFAEGGGGGVGESGAETDDCLEGLLFVNDDGGDVLVGLFERLKGLKAAVEEEHGAVDFDGGRNGAGCGRSARGGDVDMGLLVVLLLGKERPGEEAGAKGDQHGVRAYARSGFSIHATADTKLPFRRHRPQMSSSEGAYRNA